MKLRIDELAGIDPQAVPLPHGTEVTTRVDRTIGDRTVDAGAVGRVVAIDGQRVTVRIVGAGDGVYARGELVPSKVGQMRYAARRHAAWSALSETRILRCVVGSRAWGLADDDSDVDRRGVFVLPFSWTTSLVEPPLDLVSADGSETYWEAGKAIRQAIRADPNTLETLFLPDAEATDEMGRWILEARQAFASREIYGSFGRYALSQLGRLEQQLRLAEHRALLLDWLRADGSLDLDRAAARLAAHAEIEAPTERDAVERAKQYVKQLYASMYDQGLLARRDFQALADFARTRGHDFELPRELRPKNAYNLLRLIATATGWLRTGEAAFEVTEPLRSELLAIKRGEVPLADVMARARDLSRELESARAAPALPERADVSAADALLRRVREEAARRFIEREPGPFGAGAPELPEATWES